MIFVLTFSCIFLMFFTRSSASPVNWWVVWKGTRSKGLKGFLLSQKDYNQLFDLCCNRRQIQINCIVLQIAKLFIIYGWKDNFVQFLKNFTKSNLDFSFKEIQDLVSKCHSCQKFCTRPQVLNLPASMHQVLSNKLHISWKALWVRSLINFTVFDLKFSTSRYN